MLLRHRAWIGLGSNLGDRRGILDDALAALDRASGVVVGDVSSFHETAPVGGPTGQGAFLNAAAELETIRDPRQLLAILREIEARAGRVRAVRWGERTLDLDLLIHGGFVLDEEDLKVPHPRLPFRRFVLAPLAEIAPDVVEPTTQRTIADLLANLDRLPRFLTLEGPSVPMKTALFHALVDGLPAFGLAEADLIATPNPGGDPALALLEPLARKAEALRPAHWPAEGLRVPWVVADFSLGFDLRLAAESTWWDALPRDEWVGRRDAFRGSMRAIEARPTLRPTLVVVLPGASLDRRPFPSTTPLLRPESDALDAILVEVLATCQGIQGP